MKTVFFGTPEIAVPTLEALAETTEVAAVVCQPDRPAGRNLRPRPCAVKLAAERLGLPVHQPERVKRDLDVWLAERNADLAVVLAYGRILPQSVLATPRLGCVNLHASLLPEYRGAAPIARVLQDARTETGVSLMQMDAGLDTGPVFFTRRLTIEEHWDAEDLGRAVGVLCAQMVRVDLPRVAAGAVPEAQDDARATHAPPIRAEETRIDWSLPAPRLHALVRAFAPAPGAHTFSRGKRVKLLRTRAVEMVTDAAPGTVVECARSSLLIATGKGGLAIERAQLEGKKPLGAQELVNGRAFALGDPLG